MRKKILHEVILFSVFMSGCSQYSDEIPTTYVSPLHYNSYDCRQLELEHERIAHRVAEVSHHQNGDATEDVIASGVGLVFWPAFLLLPVQDHAAELGRLKGEQEAIQRASIKHRCDMAEEIAALERERYLALAEARAIAMERDARERGRN